METEVESASESAPNVGANVLGRTEESETGSPSCAICLGSVEESEKIERCVWGNHAFHAACLESWARVRPECPTCSRELDPRLERMFLITVCDREIEEASAMVAFYNRAIDTLHTEYHAIEAARVWNTRWKKNQMRRILDAATTLMRFRHKALVHLDSLMKKRERLHDSAA